MRDFGSAALKKVSHAAIAAACSAVSVVSFGGAAGPPTAVTQPVANRVGVVVAERRQPEGHAHVRPVVKLASDLGEITRARGGRVDVERPTSGVRAALLDELPQNRPGGVRRLAPSHDGEEVEVPPPLGARARVLEHARGLHRLEAVRVIDDLLVRAAIEPFERLQVELARRVEARVARHAAPVEEGLDRRRVASVHRSGRRGQQALIPAPRTEDEREDDGRGEGDEGPPPTYGGSMGSLGHERPKRDNAPEPDATKAP